MEIVKYPVMKITCERCDCTFSFDYSDIYFNNPIISYTDTRVYCPLCGHSIHLPNAYKEIRDEYEIKQEDI